MRKDAGFDVTDKIKIEYSGSIGIINAIKSFTNYIAVETLAEKIENKNELKGGFEQEWKIGEFNCKIKIEKAGILREE